MKKFYFLLIACLASTLMFAQNVNVTFNVGTSGILGPVNTIQLAGGADFGAPGTNPLSDPDGDGIYSITVELPSGYSGFYTFTNGACADFSCKENIAGQACARADNFNDRFLDNITEDVTINTCFGSCTTDTQCTPATPINVTFQLDMTTYTGTFTQPQVAGQFNAWTPSNTPMADTDGDGIWTATVEMLPMELQYKFSIDDWADQDMFIGNEECTIITGDNGEFINRVATLTTDTTIAAACLGTCYSCGTEVGNITLNVGTTGTTVSEDGIYIAGGAAFGAPGRYRLTDADEDGVYTITLPRNVGFSSFYTLTNGACEDFSCKEDISGQPCANADNFNDRLLEPITGDVTINTCFSSCSTNTDCTPAGTVSLDTYGISFEVRPTLASDRLTLDLNQAANQTSVAQIIAADGRVLRTQNLRGATVETVDVSSLVAGAYFVRLQFGNAVGVRRFVKQ